MFENNVEGSAVFLSATCCYHFRSERVEAGFIRVELNMFVQCRSAEAIGIEVGVVEQIGDVDTSVLRHFQLRNEQTQIPVHLLPSRSIENHQGGNSGIYLYELLTLHLEVGLSVFGPLNFVVVAVLRCIKDRKARLALLRDGKVH